MKVACDVCEKVEDVDRTSNWLQVNTRCSKFLLCDKCEDKFWNIFKKDELKAEEEGEEYGRADKKLLYGKI